MQRNRPTILIVGGDLSLEQLLRDRFETPERTLRRAESVAEAWDVLRHEVVPCILLHLVLKDADGRTVLRQLREEARTAATPVLVIGVAGQAAPVDDGLIDPDTYVAAPVDIDDLERRLTSWLKRRNPQAVDARRDPASGMLNRAAFKEDFIASRDKCFAEGIDISVALLAVRKAGASPDAEAPLTDNAWERIGSILSRGIRATDILARWSRNEVAVLFPGEQVSGAEMAVQKACHALTDADIDAEGRVLKLDARAGVAAVEENDGPQAALNNADRVLWQAVGGAARPLPATGATVARSRRVLIATDRDLTARVLIPLLAKEGVAAEHIKDFQQAADLPDPQSYGLLIFDDVINGRPTIELLAAARNGDGRLPEPLILLVARDADEALVAQAVESGVSACVRKPLSPLDLMAGVRKLLFDARSTAPVATTTKRLLIVEASANDLVLAGNALLRHGAFVTHLARGTADGCARFRELRPDVVLADFSLRDDRNRRFVDLLKEMTDFKGTDVILTAEEGAAEEAREYVQAGIRGVLGKPYNLLSMTAEIGRILGLSPDVQAAVPRSADHFDTEIKRVLTLDA